MTKTVSIDGCASRVVDAAKVADVSKALPPEKQVALLADVFGLLRDPKRLEMLLALRAAGELCVCDLAAVTGMSESSVSHALRLLRTSRVVAVRRRGRMAYYRLDDDHVCTLLDTALMHSAHDTASARAPETQEAIR